MYFINIILHSIKFDQSRESTVLMILRVKKKKDQKKKQKKKKPKTPESFEFANAVRTCLFLYKSTRNWIELWCQ